MRSRISGSLRYLRDVGVGGDLAEQEAGQTAGEGHQDDTEHHLVDVVAHGEDPEQRGDEDTGQDAADQAHLGAVGQAGGDGGEERTGDELALDGDVDDAGALAQHPARAPRMIGVGAGSPRATG